MGNSHDAFDGGSLVVARSEQEDNVHIHCHGHNIGDVCRITLTPVEASALSKTLEGMVVRSGYVIIAMKTAPISDYTRRLQAI